MPLLNKHLVKDPLLEPVEMAGEDKVIAVIVDSETE
jgi:hypothetical protein